MQLLISDCVPHCAGQELLNSKLIREAGLSDSFVIHAAASQKANPAHEPASEAALEQQAASPITFSFPSR